MNGTALIAKLLDAMKLVELEPKGVSARQIIEMTQWPKPTAYRILAAAVEGGLLRYDTLTRTYAIGFRVVELAQNCLKLGDAAALAGNELRRLRDLTGETVTLAMLEGSSLVIRASFQSFHTSDSDELSPHRSWHSTALGKACLAFVPETLRPKITRKLDFTRFTERTAGNNEDLARRLETTRGNGYAVDDEETQLGIRCVGAPLLDDSGYAIGAISLSGPAYRVEERRLEQLGEEVRDVAATISEMLRDNARSRSEMPEKPKLYPGQSKPAFHGGNPQWIQERQALYWCDNLAPELNLTGETSTCVAPSLREPIIATMLARSCAVAVTTNHILLVHQGLETDVIDAGAMKGICGLSANRHGLPYGAMYDEAEQATNIGLLQPDGRLDSMWQVKARIRSLRWHPDGDQLFAADPERGVIYSLDKGASKARVFSRLSQAAGTPSGMAVDTNGGLWVAMYDGWAIVRVDRFGEIDRTIALPVPRPTGVAFGGANATTLLVTSSRIGLSREMLERAPLSGWLLQVETGIKGGLQAVSDYVPGYPRRSIRKSLQPRPKSS